MLILDPIIFVHPPKNLRIIETTDTSLAIRWDAPLDNTNIAGYEVYRNEEKVADISSDNPLVYMDYNLDKTKTYSYYVKGYRLSTASEIVEVTTL